MIFFNKKQVKLFIIIDDINKNIILYYHYYIFL